MGDTPTTIRPLSPSREVAAPYCSAVRNCGPHTLHAPPNATHYSKPGEERMGFCTLVLGGGSEIELDHRALG
jgi:hypothetical protein